jgi:hypothetical protein
MPSPSSFAPMISTSTAMMGDRLLARVDARLGDRGACGDGEQEVLGIHGREQRGAIEMVSRR